jgi:hypothetical protein
MNDPRDYADNNEPPIDSDDDFDYNGHYEGDFGWDVVEDEYELGR